MRTVVQALRLGEVKTGAARSAAVPVWRPAFRTARYPANFLIDRQGLLHPAPSTDQPFAVLEAEVDRVLALPAGTP